MTWKKRAGLAAVALAVLLALVGFGLFPQDPLRAFLESRLSAALGGQVTMGRIHVVPARLTAEIENLVVDAPDYRLEAPRVRVVSRFATLTGRLIDLRSLQVESPRLALKPATDPSKPPSTVLRLRIDRLDLAQGRVETALASIEGLEAHGAVGDGALDVSATRVAWQEPRPASGAFTARLRVETNLDGVVEASAFDTPGVHLEATGPLGSLLDPRPDLKLVARAALPEALALLPEPALDASGKLRLEARVQGTLAAPLAEGTLTSDGLRVAGWVADSATATGSYRGDVATLDLQARALGGAVTLRGRKRGPDVDATFTAQNLNLPDVGRVSGVGHARGPLEGRLRVDATASVEGVAEGATYTLHSKAAGGVAMPTGALDLAWSAAVTAAAPRVESLTAHGEGTARGAWPPAVLGQLSGSARLARASGPLEVPLTGSVRSQAGVARVELLAQPGAGQLALGLDLTGSTPRRLTASGQALDLSLLDPRAGGQLALEIDLQDPLGRAEGQGRMDVPALSWSGTELGKAEATLSARAGVIEAAFSVPELHLTGDARRAGPNARAITGHLVARQTPIELLARTAGQPGLTGEVSASATFEVPVADPGKASLHASIESVEVARGAYTARTEAPFTLDAGADSVRIGGLRAVGHGASLMLDGRVGTGDGLPLDLVTRFSSDLGALPVPEGTTAKGLVAGELKLSGTARRPAARGELTLAEVVVARKGLPTLGIPVAVARIDGDALVLPATTVAVATGTVTVEGRVPVAAVWTAARAREGQLARSEEAVLDLSFKGLDVADLLHEAAPQTTQQLVASASGVAHAEGGFAAPGELRATARLELSEVRLSDLPLTVTPIEFRLADQKASTGDITITGANGALTLGGSVDLASRKVEGTGKGRVDLRALSPFLPETAVTGTADVDLRLAGTLDAPQPVGRLEIANGGVRSRALPHALTELKGAALFEAQAMRLEGVSAQLAGGTLTAEGGAGLGARGLENVDVRIEGRGLNLRYPEGLRTRANADLTLTGRLGALLLAGSVNADRGRYDVETALAKGLKAVPVDRTPSPFLRGIALDLQVTTDNPVAVRHDLINIEATGALSARGDLETPAPFGRLDILEGGTIEIQGHEFLVESGSLTYTGTWNPDVALRLTATVREIEEQQDYQVAVTASGSLDNPQLHFSSEPSTNTEAEVLSLIATGRLDTSGAQSVGLLAGNQLAILMTSRLTGGLARGIGLDRVSLQPELLSREKDPGARFTFEKQLTQRLRLIQSYSLNDAEARFTQFEGALPKNVKVLGQRDDDGLLTAGVGQKLRFGGPRKKKAPPRERRVDISTIAIEGAPAGEEAALRQELRVEEGKRASPARVQDDAERLRLLLVSRSYIEAEVSAHLDEGKVTFFVRPGPHFMTRVEGVAAPAGLDDDVRDSLYEDEALENGRSLVLKTLRDQGHLRASVATTVEVTGMERVLVFRAEPGPRFTSVILQFPGADALSEKELTRASGGAAAFVVEQAVALERVREAYRKELYLATEVGPVALQEAGSTMTVVVPVKEGPPAVIATLTVEGSSLGEGEAENAARLEIGTIYSEDAAVAAVTRLRDHYLGLGYPGVRVAPEVTLTPPDIALVFRVDEGERLLVGSIEVKGAERTSEGLVRGRVHLELGDPLDVREVTRAERRLLELGVFTRVSITYTRTSPSAVTIELQEQAPLYASYEVRYNEEDLLTGTLDAERGNLFGRGIALGGRYRQGANVGEQRVSLRGPSFFGGDLLTSVYRLDEDLLSDLSDPDSPRNNSLERGFQIQQKVPIADNLNLLFGYRFKRTTFTSPLFPEPDTTSVASLDSSLVRDSRDFALDASRGSFLSVNIEYSPEALGSDFKFVKTFGQAFFYTKLTESLIWAQAGRLGLAWPFAGQEIAFDERFKAGGATSVRGYLTDSLGPVDEIFGDPIGGNATFVLNEELRYRHPSGFGGVLFWDAGNVFATVSDIGFDLKHSVGVGLRWASPFGLLRFDLAHALQPGPNDKSFRYYFSFGQSF